MLSAVLLPQVDLKPASDVLAGAVARAASQGTIHPLDTLKVRMQHQSGAAPLSKFGRLVPPAGVPPGACEMQEAAHTQRRAATWGTACLLCACGGCPVDTWPGCLDAQNSPAAAQPCRLCPVWLGPPERCSCLGQAQRRCCLQRCAGRPQALLGCRCTLTACCAPHGPGPTRAPRAAVEPRRLLQDASSCHGTQQGAVGRSGLSCRPVTRCAGASAAQALSNAVPKVASLYKGVLGAASGAGIYIGTYFAVYGAASNLLSQHTQMQAGTRAFTAGAQCPGACEAQQRLGQLHHRPPAAGAARGSTGSSTGPTAALLYDLRQHAEESLASVSVSSRAACWLCRCHCGRGGQRGQGPAGSLHPQRAGGRVPQCLGGSLPHLLSRR